MKISHLLMDRDGSGNRDSQKVQRQRELSGIKVLCLFLFGFGAVLERSRPVPL